MKNLPSIERLRESPAGVISPAEPRRPFRWWMTGSLAVVMAAMVPLRDVPPSGRGQALRLLRHSRFDVAETLARLEVAARDRGLTVLARFAGTRPVLVLASAGGGTWAVMSQADSRPTVPMSLMVSASGDGGADVMVGADEGSETSADWSGLPAAVTDDLDALPGVVERALRA